MSIPRALDRVRIVIGKTFTAEATIQRKTRTSDNAGGYVETWQDIETYPCSFATTQVRPLERENAVRVQSISYWQFVFPFDADVRLDDRIAVGTRTFEVSGGGLGSLSIDLRVLALEIL